MDNLININIESNILKFTLSSDEDIHDYTKVLYVDEVWNLKSIMNDCPVHNYRFEVTSEPNISNEYTITDDNILRLDWNMKYITLVCTKDQKEIRFFGVYYEPRIVYQAELRKLHSYCQTCLDDRTMQDIMLVVFKRQLLETAIASEYYKDAMQLYVDICRLLDISIDESYQNSVNCCTNCILTQQNQCIHTEHDRCLHTEFDTFCTRLNDKCSSCHSCCNGCCNL